MKSHFCVEIKTKGKKVTIFLNGYSWVKTNSPSLQ